MSRNIYKKVKIGDITQGSIISGAISDVYGDTNVFGVVISARCAIAQKKVRSYHYIPMVSFSKWKEVDFVRLCVEKATKEYRGKIKNILKSNGLSERVVEDFEPSIILQKLSDKISTRTKEQLTEYVNHLSELTTRRYSLVDTNTPYIEKFKKDILKALVKHEYVDYYLVEGWPQNQEQYYVLLLQEIKSIPNEIFFQLSHGLESVKIREVQSRCDLSTRTENDLYFVHSQIMSPYIEHIIQRFYHNFGRIGIDDLSIEATISELNII